MPDTHLKILAIDDFVDNLFTIKALVRELFPDSEMFTAVSGIEGIQIAKAENPDVILLDIVMPEMDGYEVCRIIKSDPKLESTPVIFTTALKGDKESRLKALECGGEAFLAKPIEESELYAQISAMVKIKKAALAKSNEKVILQKLVDEKTAELNATTLATLNLLEDLKSEIETRKATEAALKESEEKFRLIAENTSDGIIVFSKDARIVYASPSYQKILGYDTIEEYERTTDSIYELIHPEDRDIIFQRIYKAIENKEESLSYSFRVLHKSGEYIWREDHAKFKYDADGDYTGSYVICRDITQRLKLERQYEQLFNQMTDGFALHEIICDDNGKPIDYRFLAVNGSYERQTGLYAKDIIGKTVLEVLPNTEQYWIDVYGEVALSGNATSFEHYSGEIGKHFQVAAFSPAPNQFACLIADITVRKNAEAIIKDHQERLEELVKMRTNELELREAYLSAIIDNHPGMFWMKDKEGRFIFSNTANNKFQRDVFGEKGYDLIGKTDYDFCPPYQAKLFMKEDKEVIRRKTEIRSEDKLNINGKDTWFEKLKFPVIDKQGQTIGIAGYSFDITERMKRDAQLRMQSEAFESFAISITITDKNGNIEWVNDAFERLTGYTKKEVIGKKTNILRSGKTDDSVYKKLWATVMAGLVWEGEFINKRKDGTLYTEESTITPVRDKHGVITHFISIKTNISHRKEMEEALRLSEERWQFALEGSGDGIFDSDLANDTQYYSSQWKAILGYADNEIENKIEEWSSRIHPEDFERNRIDSLNYIYGKTASYNNEHRIRCKDGSYKWLLARGIAIHRDEQGKATRIIGTISDITEIKQLEETLRKNIEKERELNEMKTRFVATASHEFRTPLASIMITNDSLVSYWDRYSTEQIKAKLQKIKSSVTFLTNIVNDVLQLSKIEEGKLDFTPTKGDIVALCKEVIDGFKDDQVENPIVTYFDFDSLTMSFDSRIIRQAITNLMSNALKYSKEGTQVEVRLSRDEHFMRLSIRDFGIGIPEEDQKHLFTAFFRASNSKMIQGNGLGLNIIRGSVRVHGGDVTFSSKINEGSTFTISLPIFEQQKA